MQPDELRATCSCGHELWKRRRGELTLVNRILKLVEGKLVAKCPRCQEDVPVPWLRIETPTKRRMVVDPSRLGVDTDSAT